MHFKTFSFKTYCPLPLVARPLPLARHQNIRWMVGIAHPTFPEKALVFRTMLAYY
ncbi:MAG: hypothetical protein AAGA46_13665 [Cyanobacteria bacterium P01_F01_bin.13]